jgi:small GTP-binding protein
MGICCVNNNVIEPQSIVDVPNLKKITIQSNKSNNKEKEKVKKNFSEKEINENKTIEINKVNITVNDNNKIINEDKKDNQYKNISANSQLNAGKETNRNSHISDNKKANSNNHIHEININPIKKEQILEKKKNKKEINLIILGDKNIGKSCFVIKFVENIFEKLYIPTINLEIKKKVVSYNTHQYQLNFIVTSGNDYKEDYENYYNEADFFLVFYDITNEKSFEILKKLIQNEINKFYFEYINGTPNILLVGNKIDLENEREVKIEEVEKYCKESKLSNFDISIKSNKNINLMMNIILKAFDQVSYVG